MAWTDSWVVPLATSPNPLIFMPIPPRRGGHRASMADTIGLLGIGWVGEPMLAEVGFVPKGPPPGDHLSVTGHDV